MGSSVLDGPSASRTGEAIDRNSGLLLVVLQDGSTYSSKTWEDKVDGLQCRFARMTRQAVLQSFYPSDSSDDSYYDEEDEEQEQTKGKGKTWSGKRTSGATGSSTSK